MSEISVVDSLPPVAFSPPPARWEPALPQEPGGGIPIAEYVGAVRRYAWLVLTVAAAAVAAAAYQVHNDPPVYSASAAVRLVDPGQLAGGLAETRREQPLGAWTDPILTQIQVLKSRAVAEVVVDSSGARLQSATRDFPLRYLKGVAVALEQPADTLTLRFSADGVEARSSRSTVRGAYGAPISIDGLQFTVASRPPVESASLAVLPRDEAVTQVLGGLIVRPREYTAVLDIGYLASDPTLAQRVVNSAALTFQATNAQSARRQSHRRRVFVEEQLRTNDSLLHLAEGRLSEFRSRQQSYSSRDKFEAEQTVLGELQRQREVLETERGVYRSLLQGLLQDGDGDGDAQRIMAYAPDVGANPAVARAYTDLVRYETARDSLTSGAYARTAQHPEVQRLTALIGGARTRLTSAVRSHVASLDTRISLVDQQRARSSGGIAEIPVVEVEEVRLSREVETGREMSRKLREELHAARVAERVEVGQVEVLDLAQTGVGPLGRGRNRKLLFGLLVGLALGSAGAILLDRLNTSIRRREEMEAVLRAPGLAVIPRTLGGSTRRSRLRLSAPAGVPSRPEPTELVVLSDVRSSGAEAYRKLMTNLLFSPSAGSLRTLVVTSSFAGEGKTTTASNLAITLAQHGRRVLLVDADLRRARLHDVFGVERGPGLTDFLAGRAPFSEATRTTVTPGLLLLPAGTLVDTPLEYLGGERMKALLRAVAERFDYVILDTPPALLAADAVRLGAEVDGVLMIVRAGQTARDAAQYAAQQIVGTGGRIVGGVLNDPDASVPTYGQYGYYYSYYSTEEG